MVGIRPSVARMHVVGLIDVGALADWCAARPEVTS